MASLRSTIKYASRCAEREIQNVMDRLGIASRADLLREHKATESLMEEFFELRDSLADREFRHEARTTYRGIFHRVYAVALASDMVRGLEEGSLDYIGGPHGVANYLPILWETVPDAQRRPLTKLEISTMKKRARNLWNEIHHEYLAEQAANKRNNKATRKLDSAAA
jgi:hypothetical protein